MPSSNRPGRRRRKYEHQPAAAKFAGRLTALRALRAEDYAAAGDQALKLIEEYLESVAEDYGYRNEGSLRRYAQWLRGKRVLPDDLLDRVEIYTEARNCLAHTYGLQTTPAFADELLDFAAALMKKSALTAGQLMTRDVRTVNAHDPLSSARDLIVEEGHGRLPVIADEELVGLLTERDVVIAQAEHSPEAFNGITVFQALPADAMDRVALVTPDTDRDTVVKLLRRPGVVACLVTTTGTPDERLLGIITHADLLYRM
ncbi:MAG: CBS domain-containing protein [Chloroflexota bacterium]|nr:MAG: hypothetical protein DIU80_12695 [Chloroflexota bacterium]